MSSFPYEDDQVTELLIDGAPDWIPLKRGSYQAIEVELGTTGKRWGIKAIDKMDGQDVFFFAERLIAVKYTTEDTNTAGITPMDGRMLP